MIIVYSLRIELTLCGIVNHVHPAYSINSVRLKRFPLHYSAIL